MQDATLPVQPGTANVFGGTPYGIDTQHLPHPGQNREIVHALFEGASTPEAAPDDHLRIVTSDTPHIGQQVKQAAMRFPLLYRKHDSEGDAARNKVTKYKDCFFILKWNLLIDVSKPRLLVDSSASVISCWGRSLFDAVPKGAAWIY